MSGSSTSTGADDAPLDCVRRWGRAVEVLRAGGEHRCADDLERFFAHAQTGARLEVVLGFVATSGGEQWWSLEHKEVRDQAVGEILDRCEAESLARRFDRARFELKRYERDLWPDDRRLAVMPPAWTGTLRGLAFTAFRRHTARDSQTPFPLSDRWLSEIWKRHCSKSEIERSQPTEVDAESSPMAPFNCSLSSETTGYVMDLTLKAIRKLLNGGGTIAGLEGLRAAILAIEVEQDDLKRLANSFPAQPERAALEDDAEQKLLSLATREKETYARLEANDVRIARLRERLAEVTFADRSKQWDGERDALIQETADAVASLKQTSEKFRKIAEHRNRLSRSFDRELRQIPVPGFIVNMLDTKPWLASIEQPLQRCREHPPILAPVIARPPANGPAAFYGAGDALRPVPKVSVTAPPPRTATTAPPAAKPLPTMRRRYNDVAREGECRVLVMRPGYQTPDGRQCSNGDIVSLPVEIADAAVKNGAVEYAEGAS